MGSLHQMYQNDVVGRDVMDALRARMVVLPADDPDAVFMSAAVLALELIRCEQVVIAHRRDHGAGYLVHRVPDGSRDDVQTGPFDHPTNAFGSLLIREMTLQVERGLGFNEPFARDLIRLGFMSAISVPVPSEHGPWGFICACSRNTRSFDSGERAVLRSLAAVVGAAVYGPASQVMEADQLAARQVRRAKREWESTVDSLTEVIVLLDTEGYIIRANRALEEWGFGDVASIIGNKIGTLLAASREYGPSPLRRPWPELVRQLTTNTSLEWEQECAWIAKTLRFRLRLIARSDEESFAAGEGYAVLVIEDITRRKQLEREILEKNRHLEDQVARRTRELVARNAQLRQEIRAHLRDKKALSASEHELHNLSRQLMGAQETERKRIARELHDSIGQALSAIKFKVECFMETDAQTEGAQDSLGHVVSRIRATIEEVRKIAMDLHPSILDDLGLISTIDWFSREFRATYPHIDVHIAVHADEEDIPDRLKLVIYRVIQEAFNNVVKHSECTYLSLALGANRKGLQLCIFDDGKGFDVQRGRPAGKSRAGLGLKSMRERVELTSGQFCIESAAGCGTGIHIRWVS
ncbi:MAG TPA: histidine kinase [Gammaproteobacteria bacterium]|nr:histidine kinase [Gammaproteobacteria bacterium]